jgi:predicted  nucleic acid-binding Zn-ribbon protein
MQMDGHRKRVERAERTISELRQAVAHSSKQARQADAEVEELRLLCARKDGEKRDLQNRVERLQQLCTDHEKSIHGLRQGLKNGMDGNKEGRMSRLQKELQRLSAVEISLRTDLEASRVENATLRQDINCLLERSANQQRESSMHMKRLEQALRAEIDRGLSKFAHIAPL